MSQQMSQQMTQQMTPEEMILQAASHIQAGADYSMDPTLDEPSLSAATTFQHHADLSRRSLSADNYSANNSFADPDSQLLDGDGGMARRRSRPNNSFGEPDGNEEDYEHDIRGAASARPGRSSANNELEMRQLFQSNKHRGLQDVATELHGNERGPNSERTRQVFAMLWYAPLFTAPCCVASCVASVWPSAWPAV